jgi:hypothetical protein
MRVIGCPHAKKRTIVSTELAMMLPPNMVANAHAA